LERWSIHPNASAEDLGGADQLSSSCSDSPSSCTNAPSGCTNAPRGCSNSPSQVPGTTSQVPRTTPQVPGTTPQVPETTRQVPGTTRQVPEPTSPRERGRRRSEVHRRTSPESPPRSLPLLARVTQILLSRGKEGPARVRAARPRARTAAFRTFADDAALESTHSLLDEHSYTAAQPGGSGMTVPRSSFSKR
jgi:hypothetical protein